jgi:hypothetical protein
MPSTADVIFILAMSLFGAGMVLMLNSKAFRSAKDPEPRKKLAIFCICGAFVGLLGVINLILVQGSGHSSATGQIINLSKHHYKHDHSSFYVLREGGDQLHVNCDYAGDNLVPGETVHVDVLNYQSTLLHLAVLDGQYAGWTLTEEDGTVGSEVTISAGLAAALTAWIRRVSQT